MSPQSRKPPRGRKSDKSGISNPIPFNADKKRQPDTEPGDAMQKDLELLARLTEQISQLPEIDAARIVELHERIKRGDYEVDAAGLAERIRQFERDLDS